jgi:hypothetical protein
LKVGASSQRLLRTVGAAFSGIAQQQFSFDLAELTQVFTLARLDFILAR